MVTARTQKTTKVSEEERIASLPELKRQIRQTDPNLSAQEIERRAIAAAGLESGTSAEEAEKLMSAPSRTRQAASSAASGASTVKSAATSTGARRLIFGVMVAAVAVGWLRDVQKGRVGVTDAMPRRLVGAFIAAFLLMILAGPAPGIAKGLAVLVGFSVVAFNVETVEFVTGRLSDTNTIQAPGAAPGGGGGSRPI